MCEVVLGADITDSKDFPVACLQLVIDLQEESAPGIDN
jgi:hypothetical protein